MNLLYTKKWSWRWSRAISTPRSEKCPYLFNDCATCELSMRAWNWNVTVSKKTIFGLIILGQVLDIFVQRNVPGFLRGQSVAKTCLRHWGYILLTLILSQLSLLSIRKVRIYVVVVVVVFVYSTDLCYNILRWVITNIKNKYTPSPDMGVYISSNRVTSFKQYAWCEIWSCIKQ